MDNLIEDLVSTAAVTVKHQRQGLVEEHARESRRVDRYFWNVNLYTCKDLKIGLFLNFGDN
jgi:hypothetical protein